MNKDQKKAKEYVLWTYRGRAYQEGNRKYKGHVVGVVLCRIKIITRAEKRANRRR